MNDYEDCDDFVPCEMIDDSSIVMLLCEPFPLSTHKNVQTHLQPSLDETTTIVSTRLAQ